MADEFVRHKSTRWVKAEVPSYGDEWGDDYEYGSNSEDFDKVVEADESIVPQTFDTTYPAQQQVSLADTSVSTINSESNSPTDAVHPNQAPNNLVLSIDSYASRDSEDDDYDDDENSEPANRFDDEEYESANIDTSLKNANSAIPQSSQNFDPNLVSRASTYDAAESETSYASDADSIQFEPANLNLLGSTHPITKVRSDGLPTTIEPEPSVLYNAYSSVKESLSEVFLDAVSGKQQNSDSRFSEQQRTDKSPHLLVLSIDDSNPKNNNSDSESDNWGHNGSDSDTDSGREQEAPLSLKQLRGTKEDSYEWSKENKSLQTDANERARIDDPNNSKSITHISNKAVKTDALDSLINDLQFANISGDGESGTYDDSAITTPISTISDGLKRHDTYVKGLSSRPQSIRKPPIHERSDVDYSNIVNQDRSNLVSVDYSNIADAVSGYLPNQLNPTISEDPSHDNDSNDTHTIHSTGSLSTGKLSIGTQRDNDSHMVQKENDVYDQDSIRRRDSTISTNTLSFGTWKPNTNRFRDKFIADSDLDSQLNFEGSDEQNYSKFTGTNYTNNAHNNSSDESIPETIDVQLPSVSEVLDTDDSDDKIYQSYSTTTESLLGSKTFTPRFQEEQLTLASRDNVNESPRKYLSMLDPVEPLPLSQEIKAEEPKSVEEPENAEIIQTKRRSSKSQLYPVFNWKQIVSTSQPLDRIEKFTQAQRKEYEYDSGLQFWLQEMLTKSDNSGSMHIGKIAAAAYQNAPHSDITRKGSLRSRVNIVKDKVEGTGLHASSFGKRIFSRSKKLMKGEAK